MLFFLLFDVLKLMFLLILDEEWSVLRVQGQGGPRAGGAHRVALPGSQDLPGRPKPHVRAHSRRTSVSSVKCQ